MGKDIRHMMLTQLGGPLVTKVHQLMDGVGTYFLAIGSPMAANMGRNEAEHIVAKLEEAGLMDGSENVKHRKIPVPNRMVGIFVADPKGVGLCDVFLEIITTIEDVKSGADDPRPDSITRDEALVKLGGLLDRYAPLMALVKEGSDL